jgi:flagellar hook protein FlgE
MAIGESVSEENTIYNEYGEKFTFKTTYEKTADDTFNLTYDILDANGDALSPTPFTPVTVPVVFDPTSTDGAMLSINGNPPAALTIDDTSLNLKFSYDPTDVQQKTNETISSSVDGNRDPNIISGTVSIFDSLGEAHTLTIKYTKIADNSWTWSAVVPADSGTLEGGPGTITFDPADGSIASISPNPPTITFQPNGGATQQTINLRMGDNFTQNADNSVVSALSQDGSAAASLTNISIDLNGYIEGVFTNGDSRRLAQILVATFPNRNALTSVGENMFTISANTGEALIGEPGEGSNTTIQSGALEQSNVDLSEEFTRMIVSQRGFQANSRVITVSDELLQEITNLVR